MDATTPPSLSVFVTTYILLHHCIHGHIHGHIHASSPCGHSRAAESLDPRAVSLSACRDWTMLHAYGLVSGGYGGSEKLRPLIRRPT